MRKNIKNFVITPNDQLREQLIPLPPRGKTALYLPGVIVGDFISAGDKPFGVEQGGLFYIRDKGYYQALADFSANLDSLVAAPFTKEDHQELEKIYQQYVDKIKFEDNNLSPLSYNDYLLANFNRMLELNSALKTSISSQKLELIEQELQKNPLLFYLLEKNNLSQQSKWLIKLDSKDSYNKFNIKRHTYSMRRDLKTTTVKRAGAKVYTKALARLGKTPDTANSQEKAAAQKQANSKMLALAKRRMRLRWLAGSRMRMNTDVTREVLATKHAAATGMQVQNIQIFEGTWRENAAAPKLLTISVWEKKFKTFAEFSPELEFKGGLSLAHDYLCYNAGTADQPDWHSASNKIHNLGQNFALFLRHGDFDAIGKLGQNKGLVYNEKLNKYEMFGIDFGHTFSSASHLNSLRDDFTVTQNKSLFQQLKHKINDTTPQRYEMMHDTPYSEKMAGIHILLKQRGEPPILSPVVKASFATIWNNDEIQQNSHILVFKQEIEVYNKKIATLKSKDKLSSQDKKAIVYYQRLIKQIESIQAVAIKSDEQIIKAFAKRLNLTATEVDLLSGIEKLISVSSAKSPNGEVTLNQIRVERKDRLEAQFALDSNKRPALNEFNQYRLMIMPNVKNKSTLKTQAVHDLQRYLNNFNIIGLEYDLKNGIIKVPQEQISAMQSALSDQNIRRAKRLDAPNKQVMVLPLFKATAALKNLPKKAVPFNLKPAILRKPKKP